MHRGSRSRCVLPIRSPAPFGEKVAHQIETLELIADPSPELFTRQQDETIGGFQKNERGSFGEPSTLAYIGGHNNTTTISHNNSICPIHIGMVPPQLSWWEEPIADLRRSQTSADRDHLAS